MSARARAKAAAKAGLPVTTGGEYERQLVLPLPGAWTRVRSEEYGQVYYWNPITGAASWIHPALPPPPKTKGAPKGAAKGGRRPPR